MKNEKPYTPRPHQHGLLDAEHIVFQHVIIPAIDEAAFRAIVLAEVPPELPSPGYIPFDGLAKMVKKQQEQNDEQGA